MTSVMQLFLVKDSQHTIFRSSCNSFLFVLLISVAKLGKVRHPICVRLLILTSLCQEIKEADSEISHILIKTYGHL